jgi:hypothetical protein
MTSTDPVSSDWLRGRCVDLRFPPTSSGWFKLEASAVLLNSRKHIDLMDAHIALERSARADDSVSLQKNNDYVILLS